MLRQIAAVPIQIRWNVIDKLENLGPILTNGELERISKDFGIQLTATHLRLYYKAVKVIGQEQLEACFEDDILCVRASKPVPVISTPLSFNIAQITKIGGKVHEGRYHSLLPLGETNAKTEVSAQQPSIVRKLKLVVHHRPGTGASALPTPSPLSQREMPISTNDMANSNRMSPAPTAAHTQSPVAKKLWNAESSVRRSSDSYHTSTLSTHLAKRKRARDENSGTDEDESGLKLPDPKRLKKISGDQNVSAHPVFLPQYPVIRMEVC
jgi:hypothetical protein